MDLKKKFKNLNKWQTGVLVVLFLAIIFAGYNYIQNKEMKQANINGYAFLEKLSTCDIVYNIDITSRKAISEFNKDCFDNAVANLRNISFKPNEKGDKFILESEEYLGCSYINNLKGSEEFKNCIKNILPELREKYPEVNREG